MEDYHYLTLFKESLSPLLPPTRQAYMRNVKVFLQWKSEKGNPGSESSYSELLEWINYLKAEGRSTLYINKSLRGLRYFYESLKVSPNPARYLHLKGTVKRMSGGLLTREKLEEVYHSWPVLTPGHQRDKVLLGFLVYQGLRREELARLQVADVHLYQGTVTIRGRCPRTLSLASGQVMSLKEYMSEVRPVLLAQKGRDNPWLLVTGKQGETIKETLPYVMEKVRKAYPEIKSATHIRSSVVMQWVREKPLREAQYLSGHREISNTDRYRQGNVEDLQKKLLQYHPREQESK